MEEGVDSNPEGVRGVVHRTERDQKLDMQRSNLRGVKRDPDRPARRACVSVLLLLNADFSLGISPVLHPHSDFWTLFTWSIS